MPGLRCAIKSCYNNSLNRQNLTATRQFLKFHRFPRNEKFRKIWAERSDAKNPDTACICSDHFKEDDYERDLKAELLNLPLKRKLKATAVPTLNINEHDYSRSNKMFVQEIDLICNSNNENHEHSYAAIPPSKFSSVPDIINNSDASVEKEPVSNLDLECIDEDAKITELSENVLQENNSSNNYILPFNASSNSLNAVPKETSAVSSKPVSKYLPVQTKIITANSKVIPVKQNTVPNEPNIIQNKIVLKTINISRDEFVRLKQENQKLTKDNEVLQQNLTRSELLLKKTQYKLRLLEHQLKKLEAKAKLEVVAFAVPIQ